jgi:hypothetical protein
MRISINLESSEICMLTINYFDEGIGRNFDIGAGIFVTLYRRENEIIIGFGNRPSL